LWYPPPVKKRRKIPVLLIIIVVCGYLNVTLWVFLPGAVLALTFLPPPDEVAESDIKKFERFYPKFSGYYYKFPVMMQLLESLVVAVILYGIGFGIKGEVDWAVKYLFEIPWF